MDIVIALCIGVGVGVISAILKKAIRLLSQSTYLAALGSEEALFTLPSWTLFLFFPLAAFISSVIVHRFAPETAYSGMTEYIAAFHHKNGYIKPRFFLIKLFTTILNIGSGASSGLFGPTVLFGSGLGSWFSRKIERFKHFPPNFSHTEIGKKRRRDSSVYMVTGAAAGMGAVFLAPFGGALASIEVLYREDYETRALVPALVGSITGYLTATFLGSKHALIWGREYLFKGGAELPAYLLFIPFICFFGWVFIKAYDSLKEFSLKAKTPKFLLPVLGALLVSLSGLFFPRTFGISYHFLLDLAVDFPGFKVIFTLLLVKIAAIFCSVCFGSGTGSVFTPSLLVGGALGILFVHLLTLFNFPFAIPTTNAFMVVGMAGFYAVLSKAPFGSVIMVCEIANAFSMLVPLFLVALASIVLTRNMTIYKTQVETRFDSPAHGHEFAKRE